MTLFGELETSVAAHKPAGPLAAVALEQSVDRLLDYSIPAKLRSAIRVGQRVRVPLGRGDKRSFGYVIAIHEQSDYPRIKPLSGIDDERVLLDEKLMELARWVSRYYVCPLGTVIDNLIPSAVKKRIGVGFTQMVTPLKDRETIQQVLEKTKAPKRRAVLARILQNEPDALIELVRLAREAGTTPATVRKLRAAGLIAIHSVPDLVGLTTENAENEPKAAAEPPSLNSDQARVSADLSERITAGGFSSNLLFGVTGSGKTEIYLRAIRQVVDAGRQAIVLVPEIALTPQTVSRFTARFGRVAVLHSGLSQTQRHKFWQQVHQAQADVIVGARSAVFAPCPNLGIIVVDEEHESSYKQDTAPRYHARDVALKRGQVHGIPVVLGSATPSLESWQRSAELGKSAECRVPSAELKIQAGSADSAFLHSALGTRHSALSPSRGTRHSALLLRLAHRVRGLALPHVELIDLRHEMRQRKGVHMLSRRLEHLIHATLAAKQQAIILLNRRGYSSYIFCPSCQHVVECKYCDTTLTYHRTPKTDNGGAGFEANLHKGQLHCHYCLAVNPLPTACPQCGKKLNLFGMGTQRAEEEFARHFPQARIHRVDGDSMRGSRDYEKVLQKFAKGEIDVLLGTQMIAKGLDYPNVTLVGVINSDTALALPDFRSAERTFQLLTQVAGRAGRGDAPGRVVLQSFLADSPVIRAALKQDFEGFAAGELKHRAEFGLPPFGRMTRIIIRDTDLDKLNRKSGELAGQVANAIAELGDSIETVELQGPAPCAIGRIAGYFRVQIVLKSKSAAALQKVLASVRQAGNLAKSDRIAVDVDPVALL